MLKFSPDRYRDAAVKSWTLFMLFYEALFQLDWFVGLSLSLALTLSHLLSLTHSLSLILSLAHSLALALSEQC